MLSLRMWLRVLWLKIFRLSEEHTTSIFSVEILGRTTKDVACLSVFAGSGDCGRCVGGTPHWGIRCGNLQYHVQEYRLIHLAMDFVQMCTLKIYNFGFNGSKLWHAAACSYALLKPTEISFCEEGCTIRVFGCALDSDLNSPVGLVEKRKQRPPELLGFSVVTGVP